MSQFDSGYYAYDITVEVICREYNSSDDEWNGPDDCDAIWNEDVTAGKDNRYEENVICLKCTKPIFLEGYNE